MGNQIRHVYIDIIIQFVMYHVVLLEYIVKTKPCDHLGSKPQHRAATPKEEEVGYWLCN